jgi:hypothetical protein
LALFGCGGDTPPPATPESPAEAAPAEPAPAPEEAAATESSESEPAAESATPKRTAKDILTAEDTLFMFSWTQSDVKGETEKKCEGASKDDDARAKCMEKAKAKFDADGVRLKKDEEGKYWWIVFRRQGNKLIALNQIPVDFGAEKQDSVVLKTTGKDKGTKPMKKVPQEIEIQVPNDYTIILTDPERGKLVYEAKIGIEGEAK